MLALAKAEMAPQCHPNPGPDCLLIFVPSRLAPILLAKEDPLNESRGARHSAPKPISLLPFWSIITIMGITIWGRGGDAFHSHCLKAPFTTVLWGWEDYAHFKGGKTEAQIGEWSGPRSSSRTLQTPASWLTPNELVHFGASRLMWFIETHETPVSATTPPHVICVVIKNQFSGGKGVPALTVCNLLLSLIYYPPSLGSWRMETSAEPFPSFQLNTTGEGLISLAGAEAGPAPPPTTRFNPSLLSPTPVFQFCAKVCCQGMWPANFNGIFVHMFIIRVVWGRTTQHMMGRKRMLACPPVCLPGW